MLFRQGDKLKPGTGALYCLVKGRLKVSSLREDGKEAILAVLEAGNWFGEIGLIVAFDSRTRGAPAVAAGAQ